MKNIFVNKFAGIALTAIVLGVTAAPAALADFAQFNTVSSDYPVLQVSDYTQYPGSSVNWSNTVSANSTDVVSFMVFYHNTSGVTANNTWVKLNLPSTISNGTNVTANITADNAYTVTGNVYVYLANGGTVSVSEITGTASWYQNGYRMSWPYGETGDEITNFANGLNIGSVAPGASGYVTVRVQLGSPSYYAYPTNYYNTAPAYYTTTSSYNNTVANTSATTATIVGTVSPNGSQTSAWFEYGPTAAFGYTTPAQTFSASYGSSSYSYSLTNLSPGTTYYYRAVASNSGGTSYGTTYNLTTSGGYSVPTASAPSGVNVAGLSAMLTSLRGLLANLNTNSSTTTVTETNVNVASANHPAILRLTSDKNSAGNGDEVNLTATIIPASRLTNATLKFFLGSSLLFEGISVSSYTKDGSTITVPLGTLDSLSGETTVTVRAQVVNLGNGERISPTAALYYTVNGVAGTPITATLDVNANSNIFGANILSALGGSMAIIAFLVLVVVGLGAFFLVRFILK